MSPCCREQLVNGHNIITGLTGLSGLTGWYGLPRSRVVDILYPAMTLPQHVSCTYHTQWAWSDHKTNKHLLSPCTCFQDARSALLEMCEKLNLFSACRRVSPCNYIFVGITPHALHSAAHSRHWRPSVTWREWSLRRRTKKLHPLNVQMKSHPMPKLHPLF